MFFDDHGAPLSDTRYPKRTRPFQGKSTTDESATTEIGQILRVIETVEAEQYIGELFRRKLGGDPPDYPRHFVALYSSDSAAWQAVGYVNFWQRNSAFMGGGLVIEDRAYRTMPKSHRELIKAHGGIAQILLGGSLKMLPDNDVVWGYVADTQAERVDIRVGFEHTHIEKIIAYWTKPHLAKEKHRLTEEIATVGPF